MTQEGQISALRIAYGENEWQFGDLRMPEGAGPHPVVIVIHGGFWKAQYGLDLMDAMADDFTARGYATWNIEYRRVGQAGGAWPGTLTDVGQAADYVRVLAATYPLDTSRVITIGHSAGGHLALWLAARHNLAENSVVAMPDPLPLSGAVSLAGVNDLDLMWQVRQVDSPVVNFLGGTPTEVQDRYEQASPARLLPLRIPQILIHGLDDGWDNTVPPQLSTSYAVQARMAGDPVKVVELPGVEHFKVITPQSEAWPPIVAAVQELLANRLVARENSSGGKN